MSESLSAPSGRLAWIDYAKAIGIVLVVFGHVNRSIGATPGLAWNEALQLADAFVYSFHMPLFFILAGYASTLSRARDTRSFMRGTWWGVFVPYLIWSSVWIGAKTALPGLANTPLAWTDLLSILWLPVEHMWFLYHLLIARAVWYAASSFEDRRVDMILLILIAASAMVLTGQGPSGEHFAAILVHAAYYGVGAVIAPGLIAAVGKPRAVIAGGLALLWLTLVLVFPGSTPGEPHTILGALLGAALVMMLAQTMPDVRSCLLRTVAAIGEASLVIYLLHLFFAAGVRVVLAKLGYLEAWTLLFFGVLAGLVGPLAIHFLLLRINDKSGLPVSRWLGFGPSGKSVYVDTRCGLPCCRAMASSQARISP